VPYEFNGGTSAAIAGRDFVVVAADTRLSQGYSILSRDVSKGVALTPSAVLATGGCWTDVATLHKTLGVRCDAYQADHGRRMPTPALAQLLSTTLYYRRFFPYYAFNVLAGLDADGAGAVYTYDAVGSFERVGYAAQGAGQKLIIPLLDNVVGGKNRADLGAGAAPPPLTRESAVATLKLAFVTAGEREIHVGDAADIWVVTADGIAHERFALKLD
jgi:20S proteasome subunit beta 6